ncbi:MAG: VOC family protein [Alphaproteobacteria bacterium]
MALNHIEHYLVMSKDLDATRDFYVNVLGMTDGDRPPFDFAGLWLYLGGSACVHVALAVGDNARENGTGAIDHIAFNASGYDEMIECLDRLGIEARKRTVPRMGLRQLFIKDPDGVTIEINYPASD